MELLPLGGNSASPPQTPTTETPAPAAPQTPPYSAPPAAPQQDANPWRTAALAPQAAPYAAPHSDGPSSSKSTIGAIALVVLSLGAGVLRAYNRQQMREERRMEQTRQQQDYDDGAEAARAQSAAVARSRAENAERSGYNPSARPAFAPPPASRVNFPVPNGMANRTLLEDVQSSLLRALPRFANGRSVARTEVSASEGSMSRATVTYKNGDVQQFYWDGTAWVLEGSRAPLPSDVGQAGQAGQAGQMNPPISMGQPAQGGQTYGGGIGYNQPGGSAALGSGGSAYSGAGNGIGNPASGTAPIPGTNALNGYAAPGTVPPAPAANPASGAGNPGEGNPPAANPDPGPPPSGG